MVLLLLLTEQQRYYYSHDHPSIISALPGTFFIYDVSGFVVHRHATTTTTTTISCCCAES